MKVCNILSRLESRDIYTTPQGRCFADERDKQVYCSTILRSVDGGRRSTLAIALHLVSSAASFHGAPATALVLAGIEEQPAAGGDVVTAAKPRDGGIAKQVQRIESDAFQRQPRIAGIGPPMQLPVRAERLAGPGPVQPSVEAAYRGRRQRHIVYPRGEQRMQVIAQGHHLAHQCRALVCGARQAHAFVKTQSSSADTPVDEAFRVVQVVLDLHRVAVVDGVDEVQAQASAIQPDGGDRSWKQTMVYRWHAVLLDPLGVPIQNATTQISFGGNLIADAQIDIFDVDLD